MSASSNLQLKTNQIRNYAITAEKMADGSVPERAFQNSTVSTAVLKNTSVTFEKLQLNAVQKKSLHANTGILYHDVETYSYLTDAVIRFHSGKISFEAQSNTNFDSSGRFHFKEINNSSILSIHRSGSNSTTNMEIGKINFAQDYNSAFEVFGNLRLSTTTTALRTKMSFNVKSTGGNLMEGLTIFGTDSNGPMVGIGTTGPGTKLTVSDGKISVQSTTGITGHGITGYLPTGISGSFDAIDYSGGARLLGISDEADYSGLIVEGVSGATASTATALSFRANKKNGTSVQAIGATEKAFQFTTYTTDLVTILGSGNVGIGTTDPGAKLQVGTTYPVRIYDDGYVSQEFALGTALSENIYYSSGYKYRSTGAGTRLSFSNGFSFLTAPSGTADGTATLTSRMKLHTSGGLAIGDTYVATDPGADNLIIEGNVGIGTTGPALKLEVMNTGTAALPATTGTTQSAGGRIRLSTSGAGGILDIGTAGGTGGWLQMTNSADLSTNYPLLLNPNGGNVGIGTTSPTSIGTNITTLDIRGTNGGGMYFGTSALAGYIYGSSNVYIGSSTSGFMALHTNGEKVRITNDGKVGIGTASPNGRLHIAGTAGSVAGSGLVFNGSTAIWQVANTSLTIRPAGTDIATFTSTGLGIGTYSPLTKLQVGAVTFSSEDVGVLPIVRIFGAPHSTSESTILRLIRDTNSSISYSAGVDFKISNWDTLSSADGYLPHTRLTIALKSTGVVTETANVNVMSLLDNGNVGIGTTNPGAKLEVNGAIKFSDVGYFIGATTYGFRFNNRADSANNMILWDNGGLSIGPTYATTSPGANNMIISGNVGIGTTSPSQKLEVFDGKIGTDGILFDDGGNGTGFSAYTNAQGGIIGSSVGGGTYPFNVNGNLLIASRTNGTGRDIVFTTGTTPTERMVIQAAGNVGIGTTGPSSKLHVNLGSTGALGFNSGLWIQNNFGDVTVNQGAGITMQNNDVYVGGVYAIRPVSSWRGDLVFYTHNDSSGNTFGTTFTEKMRIQYNGNVGIGTTSPGAALDVQGNGLLFVGTASDAIIRLRDTGGTARNALARSSGTVNALVIGDGVNLGAKVGIGYGSADAIPQMLSVNGAVYMAGNVGIGTTEPLAKLDVQGTFNVSSGLSTNLSALSSNILLKRTNLLLQATYEGSSFTGWNNPTPSYVTWSNTTPANGFSGTVLRFDISGGAQSQRSWTLSGAMTQEFIVNHTYRISFKYRSDGPFIVKDRDSSIITVPANTGNAKFFTYDYTKTVDSWTSRYLLLYFGNSATVSWAEFDEMSVEDISSPSYSPALFADSSGNVGIGTTSPSTKLHSYLGASGATPYQVANTGLTIEGSARATLQFLTPNSVDAYIMFGDPQSSNAGWLSYYHPTDAMRLKSAGTIDFFTSDVAMTILNNKNVGIGATDPTSKLDIRGGHLNLTDSTAFSNPGSWGTTIFMDNSVHSRIFIQERSTTTQVYLSAHTGGVASVGTNSAHDFKIVTGNTTRIFMQHSTGNVGINTTTPGYKLDVNGSFNATSINVNGLPVGTVYREVSTLASPLLEDVAITIPNSKSYVIGSNKLLVFVNGDLQFPTDDYTEFSTTSIKFTYDLPIGAKILFYITT